MRPRQRVDLRREPGRGDDWKDQSLCKPQDAWRFYGPDSDNKRKVDTPQEAAAKAFCRSGCPVINECREYAITNGEWGVWGATTMHDRKRIKRDRERRKAS